MVVPPVGASMASGGVAPHPAELGLVELLIVRPAGRLSVSEKSVKSVSRGAVTRILNLEFPPSEIELGEKDFDASKSLPRMFALPVACRGFPTP